MRFLKDSAQTVVSLRKHAHAIYRKFLVVKMKIFPGKILIFFLFLLKT